MKKDYYTQKEFENLVESIAGAVNNFKFLVFIGAGISQSQGYPNWDGYVEKLIHYWQSHINDFTEAKGKISNKLLNQFDEVLVANISHKRKIDLLYTLLEKTLGDKFEEVKLNFEKYFFKEVEPDYLENKVIAELIKLNPIFGTSNYDFEIEKHLSRSKQKRDFRKINNLQEFVRLNDSLHSGDILHLHGTSDGDSNLFVSSSNDYSRQYLREKEDFGKLQEWFTNKSPVVLFLGSSLEEDEILSLLPQSAINFALMKANSWESDEYRQLYNESFQRHNNTSILWFGDNFESLPEVVENIVKAVQKMLKVPDNIEDWSLLRSVSTPDDTFKKLLEKYSSDIKYLSDIFQTEDKVLAKKILKNVLEVSVAFENLGGLSTFWNLLNNNIGCLESNDKLKFFEIFQKQKIGIHWDTTFEVYEKLSNEKQISQERLEEARKNISEAQDFFRTPFSKDSYLMGYWLSNHLQHYSKYTSIFYDGQNIKISLSKNMLSDISEFISKESSFRYLSFKKIVLNDIVKVIYNSLLNNNLYLEEDFILDNFPEEFLKTRIFQRILVNLDNKNNLDDELIKRLIDNIDFTDSIFGDELNEFIRNHELEIKNGGKEIQAHYQDAISELEGGTVHEQSFITIEQISELDEEKILEILLTSESEGFSSRESFLIEKTNQATSELIINILKQESELSEKLEKIICDNGQILMENFEKIFIDVILDDNFDIDLRKACEKIYIENFNLNQFSWEERNLFRELINKEKFDSKLFEILLKIKVNKLKKFFSEEKPEVPEVIEINYFISTELGRYLDILISLNKKDRKKHVKIKNITDSVYQPEFREFTQGALSDIEKSIEYDKISINTFRGYSYSITGFSEEYFDKFITVGKEILSKGLVEDFSKQNFFLLALSKISPNSTLEIDWENINFSWLIYMVLNNEYVFNFEEQWIKEVLLHDNGQYVMGLLNSMGGKDSLVNKLDKVYNIFKDTIKKYTGNVKIDSLSVYINNQENEKKKSLLIEMLFLLLDNSKIAKSYFMLHTLSEIMKMLDEQQQKKLAGHNNLYKVLTPLEIDSLKRLVD
ncbi:SIR2 family protein [Lactococcus cremoris]|uniref:SIR2 family protein n=1 Tax=Lactococcus lactis subsp. cremoris TaxID=1359 RepID=UPI00300E2119